MNRKLTITVSEAVYEGLHRTIGRRHISQFIEKLAPSTRCTSRLSKRHTVKWLRIIPANVTRCIGPKA